MPTLTNPWQILRTICNESPSRHPCPTLNERSNIDKDEERALKSLATELLSLTPEDLAKEVLENKLIEVNCNAEKEIVDS